MQVWEGWLVYTYMYPGIYKGVGLYLKTAVTIFSEVVILMFNECSYTVVGMHRGIGGGGVGKNTC